VRRATKPSEREIAVAGVYARALLTLAESQGLADAVVEELDSLLAEADRNPAFEDFLISPLVETTERGRVLDELFRGKLTEVLLDTLQVMNEKGRAGLLRALVQAYHQELEELRGLIRVKVETAVPLNDTSRRQLQQAVSDFTGKQAMLEERIDEALVGGVVLKVADRRIDSSVAKELHKLNQKLLDRASQEIHSRRIYIEDVT
jgi:F-type H+-transporting ATPase subunit delta